MLAAAKQGREDAFSRLWRDCNPPLLRYLQVIAPDFAEDVAAETWVQVVRGLGDFRGDEAAWRSWLFTTSRRRAIDAGRRRLRRPETAMGDLYAVPVPAGENTAEAAMERLGTKAALELVAKLAPLQAEVILLRVVAGLDTEAVARLLGRSQGAVRVAAHRGLRRLAEIYDEAGVTL